MQLFSKENVSFFGYFYVLRYSLCKSKVVCEFFLENLQIRKKCSIFVRFFSRVLWRASAEKRKNNPLTCYSYISQKSVQRLQRVLTKGRVNPRMHSVKPCVAPDEV